MESFAEKMFGYHQAEWTFTDELCDAEFGEFKRIGGDYYDNSIEFYEALDHLRMNDAAQKIVFDAGFSTAYVNHKDGWQTHYSWNRRLPFKPVRGWRRRYVNDANVATTRMLGSDEPKERGYYEISYWPESWDKQKHWLESGYMRIVPDPLEQSCHASAEVMK